MSVSGERPIIIKRIMRGGGGGRHGRAWKVALSHQQAEDLRRLLRRGSA